MLRLLSFFLLVCSPLQASVVFRFDYESGINHFFKESFARVGKTFSQLFPSPEERIVDIYVENYTSQLSFGFLASASREYPRVPYPSAADSIVARQIQVGDAGGNPNNSILVALLVGIRRNWTSSFQESKKLEILSLLFLLVFIPAL